MSLRTFWVSFIIALLLILFTSTGMIAGRSNAAPVSPATPVAGLNKASDPSHFAAVIVGATEASSLEVAVSPSLAPASALMNLDFEGSWPATGWALSDMSGVDGGEYLWGKRNCHPRNGSYAGWSVGGGANGSTLDCAGTYPNNARVWATYGPFDLRGARSASMSFYYWGRTELGTSCPYDFLFVGSSLNGTDFNGARYCGDWRAGSEGNGYYRGTLDLGSRLEQAQVYVAFVFTSDDSVSYEGLTIDDVSLSVDTGATATSTLTPTYTPTPSPTYTPTNGPSRMPITPVAWNYLPVILRQYVAPTPAPTITPTPTVTPTPVPLLPSWRWLHGAVALNSLHFLNASQGWAVGPSGIILHTSDGGATWQPQASGVTTSLHEVQLVDANDGWIVGDNGAILHSANGGQNWQPQTSPVRVDFTTLSFVNRSHGWIGLPDGVLRTLDGGATWTKTGSGIPAMVRSLQFLDTNTGIAVTHSGSFGEGNIRRSTDGGNTWSQVSCYDWNWGRDCGFGYMWALHFPTPDFGFAVGGWVNPVGAFTNDGGAVWRSADPSSSFMELDLVNFSDTRNGWASNGTSFISTSDGGQTWTTRTGAPGSGTNSLQFLTPQLGFLAGNYGVVKTTDGGYNWDKSADFDDIDLSDVAFPTAQEGWAVGNGRIYHTANGGVSWSVQYRGSVSLNAVHFNNALRGWTVGAGGRVLSTTDGGATWTVRSAGTNVDLHDVVFVDDLYGWVVGDAGAYGNTGWVFHTTDGGITWTRQGSFDGFSDEGHYGVDFVDRQVGYAVGAHRRAGHIYKTTNGGNTWTLQSHRSDHTVYAVDFVNADVGWAVGWYGEIYHTADGGVTWEMQLLDVSCYSLHAVAFSDAQHGHVGGTCGVFKTNNGGATWAEQDIRSDKDVSGLAMQGTDRVWAVGADGMIRGYDGVTP